MRVIVVGAGPVGRALSTAFERAGLEVVRVRRGGRSSGKPARVAVLAVPNRAIGEAAAELLDEGLVGRAGVLLHCAGAIPAAVALRRAAGRVRGVGLIHPLRALSGGAADARLAGTVFAVEGDRAGRATAEGLVRRIGGRALRLEARDLARYHAAAALVGNHTLGLVAEAVALLEGQGLARRAAETALGALLGSVAANLVERGLPDALTGPIARGDAATVEGHLAALPQAVRALYRATGRPTVAVARAKGVADEAGLRRIARLLAAERR